MRTPYKVGMIIGLAWLGSLIYLTTSFFPSMESGEERRIKSAEIENLAKELINVRQQYEELKKHTQELKDLVASSSNNGANEGGDYWRSKLKDAEQIISRMERENKGKIQDTRQQEQGSDSNSNSQYCGSEPSLAYEKIRRKIDNGVTEIWYYIRSQLTQLKKSSGDQKTQVKIDQILEDGGEQQRSIMTDIYNLSRVDGYSSWRQKEAKELTNLVQQRLRYLQNPKDCSKAKKLVCNLNKGCGYGCQVHHVAYCMIVAYATQRTLILDSKGWRYAREGWEKFFLPLSENCLDRTGDSTGRWGDASRIENVQVVDLPIVDGLHPRPDFLPLAIPEDISQRLLRLHGHPIVWWVGQIMTYIQRPQPALQEDIDKMKEALGFTNPIVGLHVRRTDKVGTEAAFHGIEEYMFHAEEYYQRLERKQEVPVRKIYLATDDASLLKEAERKYPNYVFVSDNAISKSAGLSSRYSEDSLRGVIVDIYFLSRSDFLVCTFSSQVCRVAYEMMQYIHEDAASYFRSLDDIYYYGGQNAHLQSVLYEHKPRSGTDEIEMLPGDTIGVAGNHWDGYSKGTNHRLAGRRGGLYPSYKVEDKTDIAKMPTYPEAENFHL
ncbi:alpha-(1,6)-fucosyltransferase-like isoform X1 [Lytechinus variegatus]|uniref:alpha-(1,6)-fucosyltransferase-like isoform X1 n=1 Tax=Lytechinus variegatus TaxID=7654 RepID=UPI001BB2A4A3|nr:alpha-(1,6)-fucosyltransferase-like isoform X1 [Lytechinus variegatus]